MDGRVEKYARLQLILFLAHYACSIAIVVIDWLNPEESFEVDYNFRQVFFYFLWPLLSAFLIQKQVQSLGHKRRRNV